MKGQVEEVKGEVEEVEEVNHVLISSLNAHYLSNVEPVRILC